MIESLFSVKAPMGGNIWKVLLTVSVLPCLVGGAVLEDGDGSDHTQVYNPKTATWTEVSPMQIPRSGSAACTLNGKIYVIGSVFHLALLT